MSRAPNGQFLKGTGGRVVGSRNKLQGEVITRFLEHWKKTGHAAIDIVFKENPKDYLKIIASLLPKEHIFAEAGLDDLTDQELAETLAEIRKARAAASPTVGNA
ncbi:hypothetical protein WI560_15440 [Bradyrhizobium sp. A11]|jgi:hypothetical protein|uniref:hypothetical protein n=1 Tax=Bradyrhizobium sp. A11 TaxID=3133974 RepID=UPI00324DC185